MNTSELQMIEQQIAELQAQKKSILDTQRKDALREARKAIQDFEFTAAELGLTGNKTKAKREAKYRNPNNPSETWAGGARPKWLAAYLKNGGNIEDCRIQN